MLGTDEEHALVPEPAPERVEEVRGAVQRDRGLAGAGPARDDEHAREVGAHRGVLLGLDRGDDVGHAAGPGALERRQQRALAEHGEPGRLDRVGVEHLVVEADDLAPVLREQVAAAQDAHRLERGRPVERLGDRGAPVDDQRGAVLVVDREPADVELRVVDPVDAAEAERRVADVQRGEAPVGGLDRDVPFEPGLVGAALAHVAVGRRDPLGRLAHRVQDGHRPRRGTPARQRSRDRNGRTTQLRSLGGPKQSKGSRRGLRPGGGR